MFLEKIKDVSNKMQNLFTRKSKIQNDRTQELLLDATSEKNWHTSTKVLNQLCNLSYNQYVFINSQQLNKIQQFILQRLKSKAWIKLLKVYSFNQTFNLIQHILKNGNELFTNFLNLEMFRLRQLQSFSSYQEGQDKGVSEGQKYYITALEQLTIGRVKIKGKKNKIKYSKYFDKQLASIIGNKAFTNDNYIQDNTYGSKFYTLQKSKHIGGYNGPTPIFYKQQKNTIDKYRTQEKNKAEIQIEKTKIKKEKNQIKQPNQKKQEEQQKKKIAFSSQPTKLSKPGYKREISQKIPQKKILTKTISTKQVNLLQDFQQITNQKTQKQQQIKIIIKSNTNQQQISTQKITQNPEFINRNIVQPQHTFLNQEQFNVNQPQSSNQNQGQFTKQNLDQFKTNQFEFTFQNYPQSNINQPQFTTQNQRHFNYNQTQFKDNNLKFNNQNPKQFNINQPQFINPNQAQININRPQFINSNQSNINQPQFINPNQSQFTNQSNFTNQKQFTSQNQSQFMKGQEKFINQTQLIQNQGQNQKIMNQKQFSNQNVIQKIQKTSLIKNQDDDFQDFEPLPNEKQQKKQQNKVLNKKLTFDEANLIDLSNLSLQAQIQKGRKQEIKNQQDIINYQNMNIQQNQNLIKMKYNNHLPGFK